MTNSLAPRPNLQCENIEMFERDDTVPHKVTLIAVIIQFLVFKRVKMLCTHVCVIIIIINVASI